MWVTLSARAALRVLPAVWMARDENFKGDFFADMVLPVFRATGVVWAAAKFPAQAAMLRTAAAAAAAAAAAVDAAFAAFAGAAAAFVAAARAAYSFAADADASAADAFALFASASAFAASAAAHAADAADAVDAAGLWYAVSTDATRVEEGAAAAAIAGSQLWPQHLIGPEPLMSLWNEMEAALLAEKQDWMVWTTWYRDRLTGYVREEERELVYVLIEDDLWKQGPAIVNAEIKRRIEEFEPQHYNLPIEPSRIAIDTEGVGIGRIGIGHVGVGRPSIGVAEPKPPTSFPPEPQPEPGPVLQVTEHGLEIISQPSEGDFDEELQKALHDRLRRLLPALTDATHRVANAHPSLDHIVSEYSDLIERPFDQLDVASLWAVGTGLLAFRSAFANQASGTMTEPLEPGHFALLQQAAEMHGGFILGFPKGRELTERADHARLSSEIIDQIAPPARRILDELARANDFVEIRTRKFLAAVDESLIVHGWETARIGHAIYVTTRNSLIALGKYLIIANIGCAAILGKPILPSLDLDAHTYQLIVEFLMNHAREVLSFAEPFPELRNWIGFLINHIDREK